MRPPLQVFPRLALLCAVSAVITSCTEDPASPALATFDVEIVANQAAYSIASAPTVSVTLSNRSLHNIYLTTGSYVMLERMDNGSWTDVNALFTREGEQLTFSIAPGSSLSDQLVLTTSLAPVPGSYRLRYAAFADFRATIPLSEEDRVSSPFTITP